MSQTTIFSSEHLQAGVAPVPRQVMAPIAPVGSGDAGDLKPLFTKKESQQLVELCAYMTLFHTARNEPFTSFDVNGHRETYRLSVGGFGDWLRQAYYRKTGEVASESAVKEAIETLAGKAKFGGKEADVFVRLARLGDTIYLDLGSPNGQAIEITKTGWKVLNKPPVNFVRPKGMLPLPMPIRDGSLNDLRRHLSLKDADQFTLVVGFLISCMTAGPYLFLEISGPQGSAKSTTSKMLRSVVDPHSADTRSLVSNERDLVISAQQSHLIVFDNASAMSNTVSDALCRLSTGSAFATRKLYTDDEEAVFVAKRPVILNGIASVCRRPDLLERTILLELPRIDSGSRKDESEIWSAFNADLPSILGGLCDAVARALRERADVQGTDWPRMADACKFITAGETALGWPSGTFKSAFEANRKDAAAQALEEANLLLPALLDVLEARDGKWSGTATALLAVVNPYDIPALPRSANVLSAQLKRLDPALREFGVETTFHREGHTSTKTITLTLRPETSTEATASPDDQEDWSPPANPDTISGTPIAATVGGGE